MSPGNLPGRRRQQQGGRGRGCAGPSAAAAAAPASALAPPSSHEGAGGSSYRGGGPFGLCGVGQATTRPPSARATADLPSVRRGRVASAGLSPGSAERGKGVFGLRRWHDADASKYAVGVMRRSILSALASRRARAPGGRRRVRQRAPAERPADRRRGRRRRDRRRARPTPGRASTLPSLPQAQGDPCRGVPLPADQHYAPAGMCANVVASALGAIRQLTFAPNGDLFGVTAGGIDQALPRRRRRRLLPGSARSRRTRETGGNGNNCHIDAASGYHLRGHARAA